MKWRCKIPSDPHESMQAQRGRLGKRSSTASEAPLEAAAGAARPGAHLCGFQRMIRPGIHIDPLRV